MDGERLAIIDQLRGFALLGICLVNVPEMVGVGPAFKSVFTGTDAFVRLMYDLFVQTKFYTLFAFLFGLSFYLFTASAERKGVRAGAAMTRRLLVLLLIGLAHAVLLWFGDILHTYALFGFLLLLFYKRSATAVGIWGITLLGIAIMLLFSLTLLTRAVAPEALDQVLFTQWPDMGERLTHLYTTNAANLFLLLPEILGLFLLGMYAGRKGWFVPGTLATKTLQRTQVFSLLATALLFWPIVAAYLGRDGAYPSAQQYPFVYLSGKTLAVFFVATFIRAAGKAPGEVRKWLEPFGRMAFTNYLLQTVVTLFLFRMLLPVDQEWPLLTLFFYSLVLLGVQMLASELWLRSYRMGPLEWLWRIGVYGKVMPLRRRAKARSSR